jgi:hypothetical protein
MARTRKEIYDQLAPYYLDRAMLSETESEKAMSEPDYHPCQIWALQEYAKVALDMDARFIHTCEFVGALDDSAAK